MIIFLKEEWYLEILKDKKKFSEVFIDNVGHIAWEKNTSSYDYDKNSELTKDFYAFVQIKLHYAVKGNTPTVQSIGYSLSL